MGRSVEFCPQLGVRWIWLWIFLSVAPLSAARSSLGGILGEEVTAGWLLNGRVRRSATMKDKVTPDRGEIVVMSEGRKLILEVERNHLLLAPGFTETHYTAEGEMVTVTPNHTTHCFYHGRVRDNDQSSVVLTTCTGISGLIVQNSSNSFYLHPLTAPGSRTHMLYRTEHLPIKAGGCGHDDHQSESTTSHLSDFISQPGHHRMKRNVWGAQKYMELYIVADFAMYQKQNMDLGNTKLRIMEIANFVDKFYMSMNIKVALIGLEVWTSGDQCEVRNDANASLRSFLQWKQKLKSKKKHDNAQLITGVTFGGTTIGMAPLEGMCTVENSGGVSMDHSELAIGAAATMAHEIGHNFGMSHDKNYCCTEATPEEGGCIMAASTGHPFPRKFSSCSQEQLRSYLLKGGGMCLFNMPNTEDLVMGKKCGNGFLEEGEQCDCGEPGECTNPCCNAKDCTLKEGAQCAHGDCCYKCKLKSAGTMCRDKAGMCDLPEFCRGDDPFCPANVYMMDGSSCSYGEAYCRNGICLTHHQQCVHLWGPGAQPAPDICFIDVNKAGDTYGNCGKDAKGGFVKCQPQDAKCGKIQCQSSAKNPKQDNTVSMDTTIPVNGRKVKCRGAYSYTTQDDGDFIDPGLVMTGTKCAEGMVCRNHQCQNASFIELDQCLSHCNGHGVCNSNRHCHCHAGWAPPYCDKSGQGGSEDSGPVPDDFQEGLIVFLLLLFLVFLPLVAYVLYFWYRRPNSQLRKWLDKSKAKCRMGSSPHQQPGPGQTKTIFTHRSVTQTTAPAATQKAQKSWGVFHGKGGAPQNTSQPVNVVRPLHPPSSQPTSFIMMQLKPSRPPPPPNKSSPISVRTQESQNAKLLPPKKPLPSCPVRSVQMHPPRKPLPGNPLQKKDCLLVKTPTNSKPPITDSATQLKGPQWTKPGSRVQAAAAAFLQKQ
ncbi:disintegrin and metalloproteinase domain-containing protein 33-like [Hyperolius riggenbachi]|uniref:disintegrin and metalloproteinase domain-containing protein 33-like n=1 Tax=Hyperolius riggenbachi TaxID=752182 RepID=UPI0035A360BA